MICISRKHVGLFTYHLRKKLQNRPKNICHSKLWNWDASADASASDDVLPVHVWKSTYLYSNVFPKELQARSINISGAGVNISWGHKLDMTWTLWEFLKALDSQQLGSGTSCQKDCVHHQCGIIFCKVVPLQWRPKKCTAGHFWIKKKQYPSPM